MAAASLISESTGAWSISRVAGFLPALLLALALVLSQALIGGTRLLFCLPPYGLVAVAALIAVATVRPVTGFDPLCVWGSGIFFGYVAIRALASPVSYFARPDLYSVLAALTIYSLTAAVLTRSETRKKLIIFLLICAVPHVLVGAIQFRQGDNFMLIPFLQRADYGRRASGFYVCPNHLAGLLEVLGIFGLSITCWSRAPLWLKLLVGYLTVVCYAGVALTGSRGGYLSVAASVVTFFVLSLIVLHSTSRNLFLKASAIGLTASIAVLLAGILLIHQSDFLSGRAGNVIDPRNMRLDLWHAAIEEWKLQPIIGTGSGTYRFYGRQFRTDRMQHDPVYVHNDYLHLLCEYGILGAFGFLLFFSTHLRHGWRNFLRLGPKRVAKGSSPLSDRLALNIGAIAALGAYVIHSVLDFNLHIPANALLLAFVFGILANSGLHDHLEASRPVTRQSFVRPALAILGLVLLISCARLFPAAYYAERARTALRDENPTATIFFARQALGYEQLDPEVFFYLGRALIASRHQLAQPEEDNSSYEPALDAFKKGYRIAPLDETFPLELAYAYDELGRFAEAESMFEIARKLDPRSTAISQLYNAHLKNSHRAE